MPMPPQASHTIARAIEGVSAGDLPSGAMACSSMTLPGMTAGSWMTSGAVAAGTRSQAAGGKVLTAPVGSVRHHVGERHRLPDVMCKTGGGRR